MKLAEALTRRKALKEHIGQLKLRLPKVARVQAGDTLTGQPQESLAALEVELQGLQALTARSHRANPQMTLADGMTPMQILAQCDPPDLRQGILEAPVTKSVHMSLAQ
jgi:hypothetical protein